MDTAGWDRLEALVEQALALPPGERPAFLDQACPADPALRAEAASLLAHADAASALLDRLAPQVRRLFDELADLAPDDRARRLSREPDPVLRREVESLLAAEGRVGAVLQVLERLPLAPRHAAEAARAAVAEAAGAWTGRAVSHYQVLERLGGGMGVVYRTLDEKLGRTVALKFLPEHLGADEAARARFMQEAKAASALDHVNIGTIHEIGEHEGRLFIAMAFYAGETIKKKIARGPLPLEEALAYAVQVAEGLRAAHAAGIVHRDVKPANILVTEEGVAKIVDFGLAKMADVSLTQTGATLGTVAYMSPEQARGEAVDARADVWSLGVVLYEMLAGERPFRGESHQAVLYAILNEASVPVGVLREEVPEALAQVVEKLLRKDPEERYQYMDALLADLRAIQQGRRPAARKEAHGSRRRRAWIGRVAAAVLLLAIGMAFYLLQASQRPEEVAASPEARPMLVVLPLENLGPADQAYFAAGMTEEITSRLASVAALGVIARSSARRYAGTDKPLGQVGRELGVDYVLEGTVRWDAAGGGAGRVRITPHLVRVSDGTEVWSQTYERAMADVFAVQAEIA